MTNIFVYGTLMTNGFFNRYLPTKAYRGVGRITPFSMWDVNGSYPAITHGEGMVHGELYLINRRIRNELDIIEGEGKLYAREPVEVETPSGEKVSAEAYIFMDNPEKLGFGRIGGGRWRNE